MTKLHIHKYTLYSWWDCIRCTITFRETEEEVLTVEGQTFCENCFTGEYFGGTD